MRIRRRGTERPDIGSRQFHLKGLSWRDKLLPSATPEQLKRRLLQKGSTPDKEVTTSYETHRAEWRSKYGDRLEELRD